MLFQYQNYPRNLLVDTAMKTVESVLGNYSQTVRQLPPQAKAIYGQSRAAFPLGFGHASSYVGRGVAIIGYVEEISLSDYQSFYSSDVR